MKQILIRPIITEKSTQALQKGWFTFEVALDSSKGAIAQAVQTEFKVHVVGVSTMRMKGKTKRAGKKRIMTHQAPWKKALVKLKPNETINLFQVETAPKK